MAWNIDGIETEIEDKEEALLELEQESQDIEQRDVKLKQAIQRLSDDAAVSSLIERKSEVNEQKKEQIEEEKKRVSSEINTLQTQLQEELDGINEERNVLETLVLIGEDVSEAQEMLVEREQVLQELNWRLQDLAERLGIKLDEHKFGDINNDHESTLNTEEVRQEKEKPEYFVEKDEDEKGILPVDNSVDTRTCSEVLINDIKSDSNLSEEQINILKEMDANGELDIVPSELGKTLVGGSNQRLDVINIDMPYNTRATYGDKSFIGQVQDQEDGLNSLSVQEFIDNYEKRRDQGRSREGTKMQKQYADGLYVSIVDDKMKEGESFEQAEKEATQELSRKAVLHNPDQIVGGNPTVLSAKGDAAANSAIGSLWRHGRAEQLYAEIVKMSENMTAEEKANTYLNIRINAHSK